MKEQSTKKRGTRVAAMSLVLASLFAVAIPVSAHAVTTSWGAKTCTGRLNRIVSSVYAYQWTEHHHNGLRSFQTSASGPTFYSSYRSGLSSVSSASLESPRFDSIPQLFCDD